MYKEIKEEWVKRVSERDTIGDCNFMGWLTNDAMVILMEILRTTFDEALDFDPRRRKESDMRHPDFDRIHELSNIPRLNPFIPSLREVLQEWKGMQDEKEKEKANRDKDYKPNPTIIPKPQMFSMGYVLSDASAFRVSGEKLAEILDRDIEVTEEPIDIDQFYHETPRREFKPGEKEKMIPLREKQEEIIDDLPF